jgi:hypothetical protein
MQTTRANMAAHQKAISLDDLCSTFRDAMVMTRKLGYRYIWIDSLCIIQDSPEDWNKEAASMATVYRNATLTLSAACATSGDTGLFQARKPWSGVRMVHNAPGQHPSSYLLAKRPDESFSDEVVDGPLNTRAWCLQERYLSPCIVHFSRTQLFWECQAAVWEESSTATLNALDRFGGHLRDGFLKYLSTFDWKDSQMPVLRQDRADEYSTWYWLVSNYTSRDITYANDKLPAISGLASVFASHRQDEYLAGLWARDLPIGLLWCAELGRSLRRPDRYRAPSWSWAAWDGRISTNYSWDGTVKIENPVAVVRQEGVDPYGKVTAGSLRLRGHLVQSIQLGQKLARGGSSFAWTDANVELVDGNGALVGNGCLDNAAEVDKADRIFCLMIFSVEVGFRPFAPDLLQQRGDWAWCLLLKPAGSEEYVRVGLAQVHKALFLDEMVAITII